MQSKTTRAFRTISEAAEELELQPHVLRFWESKFPSFQPIKRGGGRRFYRPEDIEFLRGIKILLHDERHPIKDVQKLIRVKGANSIVELGRSIQKAAIPKDVKDTVLVPDRIQTVETTETETASIADDEFKSESFFPQNEAKSTDELPVEETPSYATTELETSQSGLKTIEPSLIRADSEIENEPTGISATERNELEAALERLKGLRAQWQEFKRDLESQ
ncbi:MAG: MerR family transcriptional regulator [Hellea sp.]|nr:MerR family transcriptional regulator [Hellea sp.]